LLKIGVIGTGHLGRIHTKLWSENPDVQLVGICDLDEAKANAVAGEFSTKVFSLEDIIEKCDAVTIATHTVTHYDVAKKCMASGIHCLIEKPITSSHKQALDLINISKEKNKIIQVGHVERFNPALTALSEMDVNPMFIEAHRLSGFNPRAIDVSVIHDLMIHDIDIILSLTRSKVSNIIANGVAVITDTPDICNARISFENGAVANLTASRISASPMRKMRIFQQDSYISIDFSKPDVEIFRIYEDGNLPSSEAPTTKLGSIDAGLKNKNIFYEKPIIKEYNAIAEEQKSFARSILGGDKIAVDAESATEALRIAEEIAQMI
jgi:predicted dehydrogenase